MLTPACILCAVCILQLEPVSRLGPRRDSNHRGFQIKICFSGSSGLTPSYHVHTVFSTYNKQNYVHLYTTNIKYFWPGTFPTWQNVLKVPFTAN